MPIYTNYNDLLSATTLGGVTAGSSATFNTDYITITNPQGATFYQEKLAPKVETEKEWLRRRVNEMLWSARN